MPETMRAKKHHKCVDHALNQGERNHVAVADVRHFVRQHGFHFIAGHAVDQAGAHGHKRIVFAGAGGKSVGLGRIVDGHFGRFQIPLARLVFNGVQKPSFHFVARLGDHFGTHGALGHHFGSEQGNNRAGEADNGRIHQKAAHFIGIAAHAEHTQNDADNHQHGNIGGKKQKKYASLVFLFINDSDVV
jgi:hypothetical protein